jgi:hypothetical protein
MPYRPFDLNNQFPKRVILASSSDLPSVRRPFTTTKLYNPPVAFNFQLPDVIQAEDKTKDLSWFIASIGITPNAINNPPSGEIAPIEAKLIMSLTANHDKVKLMNLFGMSHNEPLEDDQIDSMFGNYLSPPGDLYRDPSITRSMMQRLKLTDRANMARIVLCTAFMFSPRPNPQPPPNPPVPLIPATFNPDELTPEHKVFFTPAVDLQFDATLPILPRSYTMSCEYTNVIQHARSFDVRVNQQDQIFFEVFNPTVGLLPSPLIPDDVPIGIVGTIFDKWSRLYLPRLNTAINKVLNETVSMQGQEEYYLTRADALSAIMNSGLLKSLFSVEVPPMPDDFSLGIDVSLKEGGSLPLGTLLMKNPLFLEELHYIKNQLSQHCEIYVMKFLSTPRQFLVDIPIKLADFITTGPNAAPPRVPADTTFSPCGEGLSLQGDVRFTQSPEDLPFIHTNFPWSQMSDRASYKETFYRLVGLMSEQMFSVLMEMTSVDYLILAFNPSFEKLTSATNEDHDPLPEDYWVNEKALVRPFYSDLQKRRIDTLDERITGRNFAYPVNLSLSKVNYHRNMNLILWVDNNQNLTLNVSPDFHCTPSLIQMSTPSTLPVPIIQDPNNLARIIHPFFYHPIQWEDLYRSFVACYYLRVPQYITNVTEYARITRSRDPAFRNVTVHTWDIITQAEYEATLLNPQLAIPMATVAEGLAPSSMLNRVYNIRINVGKYLARNYLWRLFYRVPHETVKYFESALTIWAGEQCWLTLNQIDYGLDRIQVNTYGPNGLLPPVNGNQPQHYMYPITAELQPTSNIIRWASALYGFYSTNVPKTHLFYMQNLMVGLPWIDLNIQALQSSTMISTDSSATSSRAFASRIYMKQESRSFVEHNNVVINKCFNSARGMHSISEIQLTISDPSNRHDLSNALLYIDLEINQEDIDENASDPQDTIPWAPSDPSTLEHLLNRAERGHASRVPDDYGLRNLKRTRRSY